MKNKVYILVVLMLLAAVVTSTAIAADSVEKRGRKIKAAFLYNFINFVEWPKEKMSDSDEPVIIGVVGMAEATKVFKAIAKKEIKGKKIVVKQFVNFCGSANKAKESKTKDKWNLDIESLKKCHIVFISECKSISKDDTKAIIDALKGTSVLTVGEKAGFLENGGIVNFLTEDKKIRFEVNLYSAKQNKVKIRSKLLKLAKRVIKEEKAKDTKE
jgi:hypothetical protein